MKSIISNCKTILSSILLCVAISMATVPSAHAQNFFNFAFGFLCGSTNIGPTFVLTDAGPRFVVVSMTTTILNPPVGGKHRLRHFAIIKLVRPDGSVVWTRALSIQSLAIANVIRFDPIDYFITDVLNIPGRHASPLSAYPGQCLGVSVVKSGGQQRLGITIGTMAQEGGEISTTKAQNPGTQATGSSGTEAPVTGRDKTVVNTWMLNIANGAIARTFKPRAKPNWYYLPIDSGFFDIDDDGDAELVIVRGRFIGEDRYDYMYESYNVISGALENTTTTIQNNKLILQP